MYHDTFNSSACIDAKSALAKLYALPELCSPLDDRLEYRNWNDITSWSELPIDGWIEMGLNRSEWLVKSKSNML